MSRDAWFLIGGLVLTACLVPVARAEEKSADNFLKRQGLRRVGTSYVLGGERELTEGLRALEPLQKKLTEAARKEEAFDEFVDTSNQQVRAAIEERRRLAMMLMRDIPLAEKVKVASRMAALTDQIELLRTDKRSEKAGRQVRSRLAKLKEEYCRALLELRALVDRTLAQYEVLAGDERVRAALAEIGEIRGRPATLGPRRIFLHKVGQLEELESVIFTANLQLRADQGIFWIDAVINERFIKPMIFDTGASLVCISRSFAAEVGLHPGDTDPTVQMGIADGTTVEGKLMRIESLRVGKFVVQDVECVVLGPEAADAPPLLGHSFLRHFKHEINPDTGMLTLTKMDVPKD